MTITESDAPAFLVLPAGYAYQPSRSKGGKQHITTGRAIGICGMVTMNVVGIQVVSKPADSVCRKCIRVAQKKGMGVRYE